MTDTTHTPDHSDLPSDVPAPSSSASTVTLSSSWEVVSRVAISKI